MRDQHMNPEDAVKALQDCGAEAALAHHHGTFQLTDEAIDAPVIALGEALGELDLLEMHGPRHGDDAAGDARRAESEDGRDDGLTNVRRCRHGIPLETTILES